MPVSSSWERHGHIWHQWPLRWNTPALSGSSLGRKRHGPYPQRLRCGVQSTCSRWLTYMLIKSKQTNNKTKQTWYCGACSQQENHETTIDASSWDQYYVSLVNMVTDIYVCTYIYIYLDTSARCNHVYIYMYKDRAGTYIYRYRMIQIYSYVHIYIKT